jgi:hypothetical protein
VRKDWRDLRHDYAEQRAGDNEPADIRDDRGQIRNQVRDVRQDEANLRATEQNLRTESQDVREDRTDLRNGSEDVNRFGQSYARNDRGDFARADMRRTDRDFQSGRHTQGLTPTTLARNSAEEKKSPTRSKNLHRAWYHYFW